MDESEFAQLQPDDEYLVALSEDVWLMDDHRWALLVWEQFAQVRGIRPFSLVHADYHWDAINDFHQNVEQRDALLAAEPLELCALIREGHWIRYDSFIAPAVIRGLVNDVHFFCMQDDDEPGLDSELLISTGARQTLYEDAVALSQTNFDAPLIFDLCLDLFNRSDEFYTSDLWSDAEIVTFLERVRPFIEQAMVVTVSLSFGYSGSEADTRRVAALVLPRLEQWRSARQA